MFAIALVALIAIVLIIEETGIGLDVHGDIH